MKKLTIGALLLMSSCAYSEHQYDNFTDWSGRQFDSAGNAVDSGVSDMTPSAPDIKLSNHYQGYPYDNSKEMTDGQTMQAVAPQSYTTPGVGSTRPVTESVDTKTGAPNLPGEGPTR